LDSSKRIADLYKVAEHKMIEIDLTTFGKSALTDDIPIPQNRMDDETVEIPVTYVPARNTIFLSYALAWAEVLKCFDIFIGVNALDYSGYPDCRPEYIDAFQTMANLATKSGVEGDKSLTIHTPLLNLTKADIIHKGVNLGVDYGLTHSCYNPDITGISCGKCDACILRLKGFKEAGLADPISYQR
jgi:7-cyano-7-deazaguanine synthase